MRAYNMLDAKNQLSRLVEAVESGSAKEIVIARNGKPAVRMVALDQQPRIRLGLAKGRYKVPDSIDDDNDTIAALFNKF
jgi:prevent-host-death family protein